MFTAVNTSALNVESVLAATTVVLIVIVITIIIVCAFSVHCTDESSFEVKIEADSNDITEHPHDDKPRPYLCTVCDKRFTMKGSLKLHKQIHTGDKLYSCIWCEKRFATQHYLSVHMNVHSS